MSSPTTSLDTLDEPVASSSKSTLPPRLARQSSQASAAPADMRTSRGWAPTTGVAVTGVEGKVGKGKVSGGASEVERELSSLYVTAERAAITHASAEEKREKRKTWGGSLVNAGVNAAALGLTAYRLWSGGWNDRTPFEPVPADDTDERADTTAPVAEIAEAADTADAANAAEGKEAKKVLSRDGSESEPPPPAYEEVAEWIDDDPSAAAHASPKRNKHQRRRSRVHIYAYRPSRRTGAHGLPTPDTPTHPLPAPSIQEEDNGSSQDEQSDGPRRPVGDDDVAHVTEPPEKAAPAEEPPLVEDTARDAGTDRPSPPVEAEEKKEEDEEWVARLDSMSKRLQTLISEGQEALAARLAADVDEMDDDLAPLPVRAATPQPHSLEGFEGESARAVVVAVDGGAAGDQAEATAGSETDEETRALVDVDGIPDEDSSPELPSLPRSQSPSPSTTHNPVFLASPAARPHAGAETAASPVPRSPALFSARRASITSASAASSPALSSRIPRRSVPHLRSPSVASTPALTASPREPMTPTMPTASGLPGAHAASPMPAPQTSSVLSTASEPSATRSPGLAKQGAGASAKRIPRLTHGRSGSVTSTTSATSAGSAGRAKVEGLPAPRGLGISGGISGSPSLGSPSLGNLAAASRPAPTAGRRVALAFPEKRSPRLSAPAAEPAGASRIPVRSKSHASGLVADS
ncbi:hypothetical protein Q5752_003945 [Cryptotrichosporon argae]